MPQQLAENKTGTKKTPSRNCKNGTLFARALNALATGHFSVFKLPDVWEFGFARSGRLSADTGSSDQEKESAVLNAPAITGNPLRITDSVISISHLQN